jgi:hypothetical protein
MKIAALVILAASLSGCLIPRQASVPSSPEPVAQNPQAPAAPGPAEPAAPTEPLANLPQDIDTTAQLIVGADDGGRSIASADDARVARVRVLLKSITETAKVRPVMVSYGLDRASRSVQEDFGRTVTRQQLLEEVTRAYSNKTLKLEPGDKFEDAILLWAMLKYARK